MKLVLLGRPGAGKGTQAALLAKRLNVPNLSSGDLFRDHQKRGTELGRTARSYMERGVLVPDNVTVQMVEEWVDRHENGGGFLLDGFPRTVYQAEALDRKLAGTGGIDRALYIDVSEEELVPRLSGRLICRDCHTPYHLSVAPPKSSGRCDRCGAELYQRDDDGPEAVKKRIEVYLKETEPLVRYYRRAGKLREVNGEKSIDEVRKALMAALE